MALLQVNFFSDVLGMCMNMNVILPQGTTHQIGMDGKKAYDKYPTLYLLHGMSDDHTIWTRRTSIERYVSELGIAVVMPTTHLSWYTDTQNEYKYWTFISQELPEICREFFPNMSTKREDTFAAGLSMGGYGALKLGLGASETFSAVASLSGALDVQDLINMKNSKPAYWESIFGKINEIHHTPNDIQVLAENLKESGKDLPDLYIWCGKQDYLYEQNVRVSARLKELGYDVTYKESDGVHDWKAWDEQIQPALEWIMAKIDKSN